MRVAWILLLAVPALLFVACGDDDDDDDVEGGATIDQLGDQSVNDHGTEDVSGESEVEFEADDFYFGPTFLRGEPGQTLTLQIENEGDTRHNITIDEANLDEDIDAGQTASVEVTFPEEGVILFYCKYHRAQGMVGELLVGDAQPTAVAIPGSSGTPGAVQDDPYNPY